MWRGAFPETSDPLNYAKMKNVLKQSLCQAEELGQTKLQGPTFLVMSVSTVRARRTHTQ